MQTQPTIAEAFALSGAGRDAEAMAIVEQLAGQGLPEALFLLGDAYWRGSMVPQDLARGRELFRQASDAGDPTALRAYTNLLANGVGGTRDWRGALRRLRAEAKIDGRRAQMLSLIEQMNLTPEGDPRSLPRAEKISDSPEVIYFPRLFSEAECDFLLLSAEPGYEPSLVLDTQGRKYRDPIRTSEGSTIHWLIEDPAVHALNRRLAAASGTRHDQGEPLLILRYRPGEQYRRHGDYLPGEANQRIKTALVYLNQGYGGGETEFPHGDFMVKGRKGDAIVFRNALPNGRFDPMAEHAGRPVTEGVKYLASRWIREARYLPDPK